MELSHPASEYSTPVVSPPALFTIVWRVRRYAIIISKAASFTQYVNLGFLGSDGFRRSNDFSNLLKIHQHPWQLIGRQLRVQPDLLRLRFACFGFGPGREVDLGAFGSQMLDRLEADT